MIRVPSLEREIDYLCGRYSRTDFGSLLEVRHKSTKHPRRQPKRHDEHSDPFAAPSLRWYYLYSIKCIRRGKTFCSSWALWHRTVATMHAIDVRYLALGVLIDDDGSAAAGASFEDRKYADDTSWASN